MDIRNGLKHHLRHAPLPLIFCLSVLATPVAHSEEVKWRLPKLSSPSSPGATGAEQQTDGEGYEIFAAGGASLLEPSIRPQARLFKGASAATSGFSGSYIRLPLVAPGETPEVNASPEMRFIDPNGASVTLLGLDNMEAAMVAQEIKRRPYDQILAKDVGQVFGLAMDDAKDPSLFIAAASAYGLPIVGGDENGDGVEDRLFSGQEGARFMDALFGSNPESGPGTIYRVDGTKGQIEVFANIELDGVKNSGPGLGQVAYDPVSRQIFVSDLDTGMIHRLDMSGADQEQFDHGVTARSLAGRPEIAFDPANRLNIEDEAFDAEDPSTWHYTAPERRVWGLAVHNGRLYYAVGDGPEIWSVGIDPTSGAFSFDARWELTLSDEHGDEEISDIAFGADGSMILAQRGKRVARFDFTELVEGGNAKTLRFYREKPDDPATPSKWVEKPIEYAVGFPASHDNGSGGIGLGPAYDEFGRLNFKACKGTLWNSGDRLRGGEAYADALRSGGALAIDGLQGQPVGLSKAENSPPWVSYFHDYDGRYPSKKNAGHVGDVEILGCQGEPEYGYFDPGIPDWPGDPGGEWWPCLFNPQWCEPPKRDVCVNTKAKLVCDATKGKYVLKLIASEGKDYGFDTMSIMDPTSRMTELPGDKPFPGSVSVPTTGLLNGSLGQVNVCAFNSADKATGQPFDCCKVSVEFTIPDINCSLGE